MPTTLHLTRRPRRPHSSQGHGSTEVNATYSMTFDSPLLALIPSFCSIRCVECTDLPFILRWLPYTSRVVDRLATCGRFRSGTGSHRCNSRRVNPIAVCHASSTPLASHVAWWMVKHRAIDIDATVRKAGPSHTPAGDT